MEDRWPELCEGASSCSSELTRALFDQFLNRARQAGLEIVDLGPGWRDMDDRHLLVQCAHAGFPFGHALLADEATRGLDILVRHTIDDLHGRLAPDEEDVWREVVAIDCEC